LLLFARHALTSPISPHPTQGTLEKTLEYQSFTAETEDHEDHTFCGIFFDLRANDKFPLSYLEVSSLCVRGQLGPLTVWTRPGGHGGRHLECVHDPEQWTKVYEKFHEPSFDELVELVLDEPMRIESGDTLGVYVHSSLDGDRSIVYDDQRRYFTAEHPEVVRDDGKLLILPGTAHLSKKPFGRRAPWGGDSLRQGRLFVGRVNYGARWMLWNPETHDRFPLGFRAATETLLMGGRRPDCLLYNLGDEILLYVMNRCSWDWFGTKMRADEDRVELEKQRKQKELREKKEREIAEMFGVPVSKAKQLMTQMDPYMLQHIHQQLMAGNHPGDFVVGDSDDEDDDLDEDGSDDFDFDDEESGESAAASGEMAEEFDDAVEDMEEDFEEHASREEMPDENDVTECEEEKDEE